jgi:hypothetical protein
MKTFLEPLAMRRGSPVLVFVQKWHNRYELGIYHELRERTPKQRNKGPCSGTGRDYDASSCTAISKELYLAFLKEAKMWEEKWNDAHDEYNKAGQKCKDCEIKTCAAQLAPDSLLGVAATNSCKTNGRKRIEVKK